MPYDGEVTIQVYRKDLYDAKGLKPADTLEAYVANAAALNNPNDRIWGAALRGVAGAGQNMYIYPSIFREFGGEWLKDGKLTVNGPEAEAALAWYVDLMRKYAPTAAANWNWPDIADAFSQGTVASYIDAHSSASVVNNAEKSKVIGKVAYARWPKGPSGKRVTSIWNWGFPINAALPDKRKKATWLFIQWAASAETQARTAHRFAGPAKRSGVNRTSIWKDPDYVKLMNGFGDNFVEATMQRAAGRHRRRLASARSAMAGDRRHHGDRHPVRALRSGDGEGRARRCAKAHRADDARLSRAADRWRRRQRPTTRPQSPQAITAACWRSASAGSRLRCWRRRSSP